MKFQWTLPFFNFPTVNEAMRFMMANALDVAR